MVMFAFLVLLVMIVGCLCSLWGRPSEGIGVPIIAIATFAFMYLCQPAYMIWDNELEPFLTDAMVVKGLLVSAAALFCLMWGWHRAERNGRKFLQRTLSGQEWSAGRLYRYGLAAACVGLVLHIMWVERSGGFLHAYGEVHGHGLETHGYTAYVWMGLVWVRSGVAMMVISASKRRLSPAQQAVVAIFAGGLALNGCLYASRSDVFAVCAVLWVGWSLARGSRPSIDRATPALLAACLGALLMLGYRSVLYLGSDKPHAPSFEKALTAGLGTDDESIHYRTTGVEFVVHAAALETVDQTHKYDFALNWLPVYTLELIPRVWWPNKPPLQLAGIPESPRGPGISQGDLLDATGVRIAGGSSTGIVAEMYMSFGLFSLLFFVWLGWTARRLLLRAEHLRTPLAMCAYTMAFSLSLNVFGQGFGALLVPLPYSMVPVFLYYWAERPHRQRLAQQIAAQKRLPGTLLRSVS
jgi:hypothetical protein